MCVLFDTPPLSVPIKVCVCVCVCVTHHLSCFIIIIIIIPETLDRLTTVGPPTRSHGLCCWRVHFAPHTACTCRPWSNIAATSTNTISCKSGKCSSWPPSSGDVRALFCTCQCMSHLLPIKPHLIPDSNMTLPSWLIDSLLLSDSSDLRNRDHPRHHAHMSFRTRCVSDIIAFIWPNIMTMTAVGGNARSSVLRSSTRPILL